ncbi:hypothetical protein G7074_19565 [Pedobacter sp. HDW13]|uniref:hypothetical protein n=1 Tax=unclassified Pedobacter TaxID=2628915 RepID=UPI000F590CAA|nr:MULTISPECIES: hypothetical protein [unclassified Pedobacter]QIL41265.1 hypothetical protein G7074_19565 [Pedobacter sp. HDW13]RQO77119.1 hypothetical protein DBR40_10690 [Pedobacter sp. KBW01]
MEQVLYWRKGLFDSNYQVFYEQQLKFSMNFSSWQNSAIATTQSGIYLLKSEGFSKPETRILNNQNETLATITYDWLGFKARVVFASGETLDWRYQNSWLSRWSLNNLKDKQILFSASAGNGNIHSNVNDDMLVLTGLFIREYYSRLLFGMIILIIILISCRNIF